MGAYVPVTVKNHSAVVVSFTMTYYVDGEKTTLPRGNYPAGDSKTDQVIGTATDIEVVVSYEAFIDKWEKKYDQTFADTSAWPAEGLEIDVTGVDGDVHVHTNIPNP
jgi:hypothetical protein